MTSNREQRVVAQEALVALTGTSVVAPHGGLHRVHWPLDPIAGHADLGCAREAGREVVQLGHVVSAVGVRPTELVARRGAVIRRVPPATWAMLLTT